MGWRKIDGFEGHFYFTHSYFINPKDIQGKFWTTKFYGFDIMAAIQVKNFFGVQFHPEKSGKSGIQFFKDFVLGKF